jgi:hypothetical protein
MFSQARMHEKNPNGQDDKQYLNLIQLNLVKNYYEQLTLFLEISKASSIPITATSEYQTKNKLRGL